MQIPKTKRCPEAMRITNSSSIGNIHMKIANEDLLIFKRNKITVAPRGIDYKSYISMTGDKYFDEEIEIIGKCLGYCIEHTKHGLGRVVAAQRTTGVDGNNLPLNTPLIWVKFENEKSLMNFRIDEGLLKNIKIMNGNNNTSQGIEDQIKNTEFFIRNYIKQQDQEESKSDGKMRNLELEPPKIHYYSKFEFEDEKTFDVYQRDFPHHELAKALKGEEIMIAKWYGSRKGGTGTVIGFEGNRVDFKHEKISLVDRYYISELIDVANIRIEGKYVKLTREIANRLIERKKAYISQTTRKNPYEIKILPNRPFSVDEDIDWDNRERVYSTLRSRDLLYYEVLDLYKKKNIERYKFAPMTDGTRQMMLLVSLDRLTLNGVSFKTMRLRAEAGDESAIDEMVQIFVEKVINYRIKYRKENNILPEDDSCARVIGFLLDNHLKALIKNNPKDVKNNSMTYLYEPINAILPLLAKRIFIQKDIAGKPVFVFATRDERDALIPPFPENKINWGDKVKNARRINELRVIKTIRARGLNIKETKLYVERNFKKYQGVTKTEGTVANMVRLAIYKNYPKFKFAYNRYLLKRKDSDLQIAIDIFLDEVTKYASKDINNTRRGLAELFKDNHLGNYASKRINDEKDKNGKGIPYLLNLGIPEVFEASYPNLDKEGKIITITSERAAIAVKFGVLKKRLRNGPWPFHEDKISVTNLVIAICKNVGFKEKGELPDINDVIRNNTAVFWKKINNYGYDKVAVNSSGDKLLGIRGATSFFEKNGLEIVMKEPMSYFGNRKGNAADLLKLGFPYQFDSDKSFALSYTDVVYTRMVRAK